MKCVSDALASTLIPRDLLDAHDPSAPPPTTTTTTLGAGCSLFEHAYRNILTKYWVSVTSAPCRGRLTGFAALQFTPSGGQFLFLCSPPLPPKTPPHPHPGRRGVLTRRRRSPQLPCRSERTIRKSRSSTAIGGTPKNSLSPGSKNIIYISLLLLFICRQTFSGSEGTRFR